MTQKKTKAEIPADMWLHVATDALARYIAGGGKVEAGDVLDGMGEVALMFVLPGVSLADPRLSPPFVNTVTEITELLALEGVPTP
jgi:hypothetical protein